MTQNKSYQSNNSFFLNSEKPNQALIRYWHKQVYIAQRSHFKTSVCCLYQNVFITISLLITNCLVIGCIGLSEIDGSLKLWINGFVLFSSILSGLKVILEPEKKAEQHRISAIKFCNLQAELEEFYVNYLSIKGEECQIKKYQEFINYFNAKYNRVENDTPIPMERHFQQFKKCQEYNKEFLK